MDNSTAKKFFTLPVVIVMLVVIVGVGLFAFRYLDIQPDSKKISCNKLPTVEEAQKVLTANENVIKGLEGLSDTKSIWFSLDTERCSGRADILIYYGTETQRKQIKERIGEKFFGVPYRMFNI